jgi:hypothetical protein
MQIDDDENDNYDVYDNNKYYDNENDIECYLVDKDNGDKFTTYLFDHWFEEEYKLDCFKFDFIDQKIIMIMMMIMMMMMKVKVLQITIQYLDALHRTQMKLQTQKLNIFSESSILLI